MGKYEVKCGIEQHRVRLVKITAREHDAISDCSKTHLQLAQGMIQHKTMRPDTAMTALRVAGIFNLCTIEFLNNILCKYYKYKTL